MKYEGRFRTLKDEMIQVVIITNNDASQEEEIFFADESPVMISQSSDGIFSPIKSRSCTIKLVTKDVYFDIYSGSSHGTSVAVNNLTNSECLFYGYVTPCQYNQPYLYNNEIEIEAVDAISTLQDFKYSYLNGKESSVAIIDIIKKLISIAGYSGKIYMQYNANKMKAAKDYTPTQFEYINDAVFYEDSGEASDCYAVLEEICNFYGISCVPYGNDVFFVDYQVIAYVEDDNFILLLGMKSGLNNTVYNSWIITPPTISWSITNWGETYTDHAGIILANDPRNSQLTTPSSGLTKFYSNGAPANGYFAFGNYFSRDVDYSNGIFTITGANKEFATSSILIYLAEATT